jgi:hypothetical protein
MNAFLNNPNGLGIGLLAKLVGIDRKNLKLYLTRLIKSGYVKKKDGHRGKYFPTKKIIKNPILSSTLMAESFASDLLGKSDLILSDSKTIPNGIDFRVLLTYMQREDFRLPRVIFEFAIQIGAYVLYCIIQSMNEDNKILKKSKYLKKDSIIQEIVKYSILPIIPDLLSRFKDSIRIELSSLKGNDEDPFGRFIRYGWSRPEFQLEKTIIDEITTVYSGLFPTMYTELENIRNSLPRLIEVYDNHTDYLRMQAQYQKSCKHRYLEDVSRLIELDWGKFWTKYREVGRKTIVHCANCHHTTYRKYVTNCENKSYQELLK